MGGKGKEFRDKNKKSARTRYTPDGDITVTNGRNNFTGRYKARAAQ